MATVSGAVWKNESSKPVIGGVLVLVGAILLLLGTFWCFIIAIPLAIIAILGAVYAIQRKHFAMALVAGILTIPTILGLIGLILIALSQDEFD
jgi:hypothetical protein